MSSLGFHSGSSRPPARSNAKTATNSQIDRLPTPTNLSSPKNTRDADSSPRCGLALTSWLVLFHLLLFGGHTACAVVASGLDIRFPITILETRLRDSTITEFKCIYDFSNDPETNESFCRDPAYRSITVTNSCIPTYQSHLNTSYSPFVSDDNSINLDAYALQRVPSSYSQASGVAATRWILFTIEVITAVFHIIYAATTLRIGWELSHGGGRTTDFVLSSGGIPARWYEYSFTASLMSFFIGNTANVYDFYALLAFSLGTFALMYFGAVIEHFGANSDPVRSLVYLYVPGTALFALTWLPPIRQLFTDIARLSCSDQSQLYFSCAKTCFGADTPIGTFVIALLALFLVFPLIALYKIYILGGWQQAWHERVRTKLDGFIGIHPSPLMAVTKLLVLLLSLAGAFGVFILYGAFLATRRIVDDIVWPIIPHTPVPYNPPVSRDIALRAFFFGETAYAAASATSKFFLFIYFATAFAMRDW